MFNAISNYLNRLSLYSKDVSMGRSCTFKRPSNIYGCKFGNNVFVGPFVEIQKNVSVGDRTRIQSHSFVCEYVTIGNDCFIAHGVVFTNDKFQNNGPARRNTKFYKETIIGNGVSIGSNCTVLPVEICDGVIIGAHSLVTKNISQRGVYAGFRPGEFP